MICMLKMERSAMVTLKPIPIACRGCTLEPPQLNECRIRQIQFRVFGKECPREKELARKKEKK